MSTIKKFVEFVLGIFLCLFLFLSLFSLTGYQLTSVETVKDILKSVILQSPEVSNSTIEVYTSMRQVCELDPNMEFDNINAGITTITIKCSEILPLNYDGFVSHIIDKIVNSIYYTEPKCEILECLREGGTTALLAFLTEKTHKTIFSFFSYMVLISFLIILVLIYLTEKYWKLRTIGICFGVVGFLGFIVVASINSYLEKSPFIGRAEISQIVINILSVTMNNFTIFLIIGIVLILLSYLLEFYKKRKVPSEKIEVKVEKPPKEEKVKKKSRRRERK